MIPMRAYSQYAHIILLKSDTFILDIERLLSKKNSLCPSEICDERTASRLGWFNAALPKSSSIQPSYII